MIVRICPIEDTACEELPMFLRCEGCKKPQPAPPDYRVLYEDLLFQVSQKFKDETRHQTAKRYIASWEGRSVQSEPSKTEPKP